MLNKSILAIKGGTKIRTKPFNNWPELKENDLEQIF